MPDAMCLTFFGYVHGFRIVYISWTFNGIVGCGYFDKNFSSCGKQIALTHMWGANYDKCWQFEKKKREGKKKKKQKSQLHKYLVMFSP